MKDGGFAFAQTDYEPGMTMRQWYKGMIVEGELGREVALTDNNFKHFSNWCGKLADSLIAEDEKHERGKS